MEEVFDMNTGAYMDSFNILEGQVAVLQRVILDQEHDRIVATEHLAPAYRPSYRTRRTADGTIDYHAYLMEYYVCQTMAGFAAWLKGLAPASVIVAATDETPLIFGG